MKAVMTEQHPRELLVQRAQAGDRAAFDELFRTLENRLLAFIRSRIPEGFGAQLEAQDILQDTLVRAFQYIDSFRGQDAEGFRRWLTGVANKTVLRAMESLRRNRTLDLQDSVIARDASPSKEMRREERLDRLQVAIDSLKGEYREVIFLTRVEGLTLKQAADRMGRSSEAVRKLFWRALQQLRSTLSNTASLHLPDRRLEWEGQDDAGRR